MRYSFATEPRAYDFALPRRHTVQQHYQALCTTQHSLTNYLRTPLPTSIQSTSKKKNTISYLKIHSSPFLYSSSTELTPSDFTLPLQPPPHPPNRTGLGMQTGAFRLNAPAAASAARSKDPSTSTKQRQQQSPN